MKIYDVTLTISPQMVTWPGDPSVALDRVKKIEDGANANVSALALGVHTGTHVDAPFHFIPGAPTVETLDLDILVGPVQVVELPENVNEITEAVLQGAAIPEGTTRILFKTRNSGFWARDIKEFQPGFVGVGVDGAEYLVKRGIRLMGIDYLSVAPYKRSRPTHEVLLNARMIVIEGLDLSMVKAGLYTLYCLPLKLAHTDGAPARVILVGD
jgi:arylformamidase